MKRIEARIPVWPWYPDIGAVIKQRRIFLAYWGGCSSGGRAGRLVIGRLWFKSRLLLTACRGVFEQDTEPEIVGSRLEKCYRNMSPLTILISRQSFEPSQVPVLRGNTCQQGVSSRAFPIRWMSVRSLLLYISLYHSPSSPSLPPPSAVHFSFCRVEFPQLFQLCHRYRRIVTRANNDSSRLDCGVADMFPLWCNSTKDLSWWQTK